MQILLENFNRISFSDMSRKKSNVINLIYNFGFTSVIVDAVERPQCVGLFRPAKLKQPLRIVHPQSIDKSYFERQNKALKMMKLNALCEFCRKNRKIIEASYEVALKIAKQKNNIREALIKSCVLKMAN